MNSPNKKNLRNLDLNLDHFQKLVKMTITFFSETKNKSMKNVSGL